jgi:hypothetical protein
VAKKVTVIEELVDDIDGDEAKETITFGVDGVNYEIDLNDRNIRKFRRAVEPFVEHGRKASKRSGGTRRKAAAPAATTPTRSTNSQFDPAVVRAWAAENGIEVGVKGVVPKRVVDQYMAAQAG